MNSFRKNSALLIVCVSLATAIAISASGERVQDEISEEVEFDGQQVGGRNDVLARVSGGLSNILGVRPVDAPLSPTNLKGKSVALTATELVGGKSLEAPAPSALAREVNKEVHHDLFSLEGIGEWAKLLFNPIELVKAIGAHFKLDAAKFIDKIGRGVIFGVEASLSPLLTCVKIVEKIFVPDACRLKFMCRMGTYFASIRASVLKLSPHFLETSVQFKAFSDGIVGHDCESSFALCEPKLKKPFEELKIGGLIGSNYGARSGPKEGLAPKSIQQTVKSS